MFVFTEVTLTVANIERCLVDSVPRHLLGALNRELRVPPRDTAEDTLCSVKMWLLFDSTASWQKFAMALYSCNLDGALKILKELKYLPIQGIEVLPHELRKNKTRGSLSVERPCKEWLDCVN